MNTTKKRPAMASKVSSKTFTTTTSSSSSSSPPPPPPHPLSHPAKILGLSSPAYVFSTFHIYSFSGLIIKTASASRRDENPEGRPRATRASRDPKLPLKVYSWSFWGPSRSFQRSLNSSSGTHQKFFGGPLGAPLVAYGFTLI